MTEGALPHHRRSRARARPARDRRSRARLEAPGRLAIGPEVAEFERRGAELLAKRHGVMVNSGTSALWLAIDLLGCEPGDEIITSPLTFSTDIAPLVRNGIVPVFVDVDPETLQIDVDGIEEMIGPRTKAILAAQPRRQLPRLGRHPRHRRPPRPLVVEDSCDVLDSLPPRHPHRHPHRHLGDQLRPRPPDHRRQQRRHGRIDDGVLSTSRSCGAWGRRSRALPVRQQAGRRRPLRHAGRRHAVRPRVPLREHRLQLRAVRDRRRVRATSSSTSCPSSTSVASRTSPQLDECSRATRTRSSRSRTTPDVDTTWMRFPLHHRATGHSTAPTTRSSCSSPRRRHRAWSGQATSCASPGSPASSTAPRPAACRTPTS